MEIDSITGLTDAEKRLKYLIGESDIRQLTDEEEREVSDLIMAINYFNVNA